MLRQDGRSALPGRPLNPLKTLAESRNISFDGIAPPYLELLQDALARAEVSLCGYSTTLAISREIKTDFQVRTDLIILHESVFSCPSILRLHLRHALELMLWLQLGPIRPAELYSSAIALLSAVTATRFYLQMLTPERQKIAGQMPGWLREAVGSPEADILQKLSAHLLALMPLQGQPLPAPALIQEAVRCAALYLPVAPPTEFILTQQGDERLLIDPATGLNKYGCSPRPRPEAITFSSCTASSVSEFAYREAEALRHRLMKTFVRGNLAVGYEREIENVRSALKKMLGLSQETEVILSSSGTDAELYPLALLRTPDRPKLINIIVAPDELGSGTVQAAGGRHFSARTPLGVSVAQGGVVAGLEGVEVIPIPIRGPDGARLPEAELQRHIRDAATAAAQLADHVILHMVDNSKTGVVAPDVDFVCALQEQLAGRLQVLVDACQFRVEHGNLQRYLACGFWVLITGSKFFTGPPFGAALLLPTIRMTGDATPLPGGFGDYFTSLEVPRVLRSRAERLASALNFGLLFRWIGAIKEMHSFYSVPGERRAAILKDFCRDLAESIRANPDLLLLDCPPPQRWRDADAALWDALPTIFSFAVRNPRAVRAGQWLPLGDLRKIYYLLNRDCSLQLPVSATEAERSLAAQKCHLGQPVLMAQCPQNGETSAMRIAFGARLVYRIEYDPALGESPLARYQQELTDAQTVLRKISLILSHWEALRHEAGFKAAELVPAEAEGC